jgi:hypothetical protein
MRPDDAGPRRGRQTLRWSRHIDRDATVVAGRHLLAVIDQHTRLSLGQVDVGDKTNEITAFTPLLETLTSIDLAGAAGTWRTETVYAITDLRTHQARPDDLAAWIRGHWQTGNGCSGCGMSLSPRTSRKSAPVPPRRSWRPSTTSRSACTVSPAPPTPLQRYDITPATPSNHSNHSKII